MSDWADDGGTPEIMNYDLDGMKTSEDLAVAAGDDPSPGLDVAAQIHLQLCAIGDKLDRAYQDACQREQLRLASLPNIIPLIGATPDLGTASGSCAVVDLGTPQLGRQWHVEGLTVALNNQENSLGPTTRAMINWYVGPLPPRLPLSTTVPPGIASTQLRWTQNGSQSVFGASSDKVSGQIVVNSGEHLFGVVVQAAIASGSPNVYVLIAMVADLPVKSAAGLVDYI